MITLEDLSIGAAGPYRGTLPANSVLGLVGRSGAGTTALLEAMCGVRRHGGRVLVHGRPLKARDVAFAPEEPEQILFGATARSAIGEGAGVFAAALGAQDLMDRDLFELSSGERRRLALAAVLATRRPLLLFDAPTAGLDPDGQARFWAALAGQTGAAVVALWDASEAQHCSFLLAVPGAGTLVPGGPIAPAALQRAAGWPPDAIAELGWTLESGAETRKALREEVEAEWVHRLRP